MIVCNEFSYFKAFNQKDYNKNKLILEIASEPEVRVMTAIPKMYVPL